MTSNSSPQNPSATTWMGKLDALLAEKNFITDGLDKIEQKTNVKKRYVALVEQFDALNVEIYLKCINSFYINVIDCSKPARQYLSSPGMVTEISYWVTDAVWNLVKHN